MIRETIEVTEALDQRIEELTDRILEHNAPLELTQQLRWVRSTLVAVKSYAEGESEEIEF